MLEPRAMTQAEFMRHFNLATREPFNAELFRRDNHDIVEAVSKVILSSERDKCFTLKVLSIDVIEDYEAIYDALRTYEQEKIKKGSTENPYDYISMRDSDIILLDVRYLIRKNGVERMKIDGKEQNVTNPEQILRVLVALPRYVDKYYTRLSGNYYSLITQLVDASTYNNATTANAKADSVTEKTLSMAIRMFRVTKDMVDFYSKESILSVVYTSIIFDKHVNAMYYIFAKYGFYPTMELFGTNFIRVTEAPILDENWYSFAKHNLYVCCPKAMYKEPAIQAICVSIYDAIQKDCTLNDIYDAKYWLTSLGGMYRNSTIDKGLEALDSLESVYDLITKDDMRLPPEDKENIYMILKWMIVEFSALKAKDNVDVSIKKRRIADYIAHVYATKLNRGIHRICNLGRKVKMKNIISAVCINPMYIINTIINMSNLVSYVDMVNDNDALLALKCTYKGISGLGESGSSVQECYRLVDPSSIGILDPDASSNSDPGMTAMLCPMAKTYGNLFSDFHEPNNWRNTIANLNDAYRNANNLTNPLLFGDGRLSFAQQYDYVKEKIEIEANIFGRKICPIKDLDGLVDYSTSGSFLVKPDNDDIKSLFTIIDEED